MRLNRDPKFPMHQAIGDSQACASAVAILIAAGALGRRQSFGAERADAETRAKGAATSR